MRAKVLIVDDEELTRLSLAEQLAAAGFETSQAANGKQALEQASVVDAILLDYRLPDADGIELLQRFQTIEPPPITIMMTAYSSVDTAVDAIKHGAFHFVTKPINNEVLRGLLDRALTATKLEREVRAIRSAEGDRYSTMSTVGESAAMRKVKLLVQRIARSPASSVLLTGETGTGKDLIARVIHHSSDRVAGPFMNITCSALPETLLESELFGHERGAFTDAKQQKKGLLELANGGTVFLDEIGEMPLAAQATLLRFLEERAFRRVGGSADIEVDVRVIAATNVDLQNAVKENRFREDLYYRLSLMPIELPPLRARNGDVELLAKHFVASFANEFGKHITGISDAALEELRAHRWPGNVRELRNVVERAVLLSEREVLEPDDIWVLGRPTAVHQGFQLPPGGVDFEQLERQLVVQALERVKGNQTQAGRLLGMKRDQIRYRIDKFGLDDLVGRLTGATSGEAGAAAEPAAGAGAA